jgi:hypothetical protein
LQIGIADCRLAIDGLMIVDWLPAASLINRQSVDRQSPIFNPNLQSATANRQ